MLRKFPKNKRTSHLKLKAILYVPHLLFFIIILQVLTFNAWFFFLILPKMDLLRNGESLNDIDLVGKKVVMESTHKINLEDLEDIESSDDDRYSDLMDDEDSSVNVQFYANYGDFEIFNF